MLPNNVPDKLTPLTASVSVIVPVYNAEKYLRETIDSIISQTRKDIEIILVDDGSKDSSSYICDEYRGIDKRIVVVHQENGGVSKARNAGIRIAKGKYVSFVDSDDTIEPNMYEEMLCQVEGLSPDLIDCGYKIVAQGDKKQIGSCHNHPKNKLLGKDYIFSNVIPAIVGLSNDSKMLIFGAIGSKLYRLDTLRQYDIKFNEDRMKYEDRLFLAEYLHKAKNIFFVNGYFYNYVKRTGSQCSKYHSKDFDVILFNQVRYRQLFGDYFDFNGQIAVLYRLNAIADEIFNILLHRKQERKIKERIVQCLMNHEVQDWYSHFLYTSFFHKAIKACIMKKKYSQGYYCFLLYYLLRRGKRAMVKTIRNIKPTVLSR